VGTTMARPINRLSPLTVKSVPPGMYCDGGGLYLQVTKGTDGALHRSWLYRFAIAGRERQMGLGSFPTVTIAEARAKATDARKLVAARVDPIVRRNAQAASARASEATVMTFDECATAYVRSHRAGWRSPKHAEAWTMTLAKYVSPVFGGASVAAVDTALVTKALEPIWTAIPESASRTRGRIELVLDWATARGYRKGDNPARWRGHLDKLLPARAKMRKVKHHAALAHADLSAFLAVLRGRAGTAARALEFVILTAARSGEAIGAKWSEIDLAAKVWTVPAERMKAHREHRVPLSAPALALLEAMAESREGDAVFPGERTAALSHMALTALLRRMKRRDITPHGFRATFRTWAGDCTAAQREVIEAALAHVVGDETERAYSRGDAFEKRRRLMDDWAAFCERPPATERGNVISMRGSSPNSGVSRDNAAGRGG
jgi:integrase